MLNVRPAAYSLSSFLLKIKVRNLNLYSRILLWFVLNVAVLGVAIFGVLRWQFGEGLGGALGNIAGDRLQAIGSQMSDTLSTQPEQKWSSILTALGRRHDVQVALILPPNRVVAGDPVVLPAQVAARLQEMERMRPRDPEDRGPPDGRLMEGGRPPPPPPPPHRDALEDFLFGDSLPQAMPPPGPPPDGSRPLRFGTFLMQAGEPQRYWAAVRLPPPPSWRGRNEPLALIIVTRSMTGGGLFFDVQPWLVGIFGAMVLSAFLWWPLVRGITHSIRQHMQATEQIAKGRFDVRVPEDRGDELGRLAHAVNQMAVQLDGMVRGQKRFLGDIAHELCSPIARMEMSLGILEQHVGEKGGRRLADVRDELRQISLMVNELLSFSKAALGHDAKPLETVELEPLVREVMTLEGISQDQFTLALPTSAAVKARPDLLRRAIGNVLRNAIRHAPDSAVDISAIRSNGHVRLSIMDHGEGVPAESLPRLFEPFYRVDASRTRDTGGVGLGLSIVKSCVESCGGTVTADNQKPHGLRIDIELASA